MQVIYKYHIKAHEGYVDLPAGAEILSVGQQQGRVYLWAKVDTDKPAVSRAIYVIPTGYDLHQYETLGRFVGTVHMLSGLVWHIFEGA